MTRKLSATSSSIAERAATRSYGFQSSRVSEVLSTLQRQPTATVLAPADRTALEEGRDLLDTFVTGSELVEGRSPEGLAPKAEAVAVLPYAFSALRALSIDQDFATELTSMRKSMNAILEAGVANAEAKDSAKKLGNFFTAIALTLSDDLARHSLGSARPVKTSDDDG